MQTPGVERMLRTRGRRSVIRVCRLTVRLYPSPGRIGSDDVPVLNPQQHRDISLYGSRPVAGGCFLPVWRGEPIRERFPSLFGGSLKDPEKN